jgi:hypothetical protein
MVSSLATRRSRQAEASPAVNEGGARSTRPRRSPPGMGRRYVLFLA